MRGDRAEKFVVFNLRRRLSPVLQAESRTGTASRAAQNVRHLFIVAQIALAFVLRDAWLTVALSLLYLVTMVLTEMLSNASTAVLMVPVAMSTAAPEEAGGAGEAVFSSVVIEAGAEGMHP